jgi:hypothetical protein
MRRTEGGRDGADLAEGRLVPQSVPTEKLCVTPSSSVAGCADASRVPVATDEDVDAT